MGLTPFRWIVHYFSLGAIGLEVKLIAWPTSAHLRTNTSTRRFGAKVQLIHVTHLHAHTYAHIHTYTHIHMHAHTYIHKYMHTGTHHTYVDHHRAPSEGRFSWITMLLLCLRCLYICRNIRRQAPDHMAKVLAKKGKYWMQGRRCSPLGHFWPQGVGIWNMCGVRSPRGNCTRHLTAYNCTQKLCSPIWCMQAQSELVLPTLPHAEIVVATLLHASAARNCTRHLVAYINYARYLVACNCMQKLSSRRWCMQLYAEFLLTTLSLVYRNSTRHFAVCKHNRKLCSPPCRMQAQPEIVLVTLSHAFA